MAEMESGYPPSEGSEGAGGESSRMHRAMDKGRHQAEKAGGKAREKLLAMAEERKQKLSEQLETFAENIDKTANGGEGGQAEFAHKVSGYVRKAKELLDRHSTEEIVDRAVNEVRDRPGVMIGGALAVGFLVSRLARS